LGVDLDDPRHLLSRRLRPSRVATRDRSVTQPIALTIFDQGHAGFAWWSTLEASWMNVTLFAERAVQTMVLTDPPQPLTVDLPVVRRAAELIGVRIAPG